jgi:hypothetical protein
MEIPDVFLPYRFYGFERQILKNKLLSELSNFNVLKTDKVLAAWRPLLWDSRHFHHKMLELITFIPDADAKLQERSAMIELLLDHWQEFDHATARINAFDIMSAQAFERAGFSLMDTNVRYGIDLRNTSIQEFEGSSLEVDGLVYEVVSLPCHCSELDDIARVSWSDDRTINDRFHLDKRLPVSLADSVYTEWLKNSLTGELADTMVISRFRSKAIGFLALKKRVDSVESICIGLIGLGAVYPSMRRKNVYFNMVSLGLRILSKEADIVETGTQLTNYAPQRAWTRAGLKQVSTTYTFQKWLNSY